LDEYQGFENFFDFYFADLSDEEEQQVGSSMRKSIPDALTLIQEGIAAGVLS